jgi:subtilisin family serine protease
MSDRNYVVLQLVTPEPRPRRGFTLATLDAASEPPRATVEVQSLSPQDVADARRTAGVLAAPVIPLKLVEPVAVDDAAGTAAVSGPTWGVTAVGAAGSTATGKGAKVAVLDTGIDKDHPAFADLTVTEQDFTGEGDGDWKGHGTHCAGTIAGADVNGTRIGIAREIDELLIGKVLGQHSGGDSASLVRAMLWAADGGANVISMSLGIDFPGLVADLTAQGIPIAPATSRALKDYRDNVRLFESAVGVLESRGRLGEQPIVVVAASGNESDRNAYTIDVSPPAASTGFIKVAAVGQDGGGALVIAPFSNTGVDVAGPGVDVLSAKVGGGLTSMNGTSMATPHVSGVAALWMQSLGVGATADALRAHLSGRAQPISGLSFPDVGSGLVQAP